MIAVIMIEPEIAGNIGAAARIMKNFDFYSLVLVNPKADHTCEEARCRAKHANDVLDKAKVCGIEVLKEFDVLVGTTAKMGGEYNLPRCVLTPKELSEKIKDVDPSSKIGLVFGRESKGLFNEELKMCDFSVSIESSDTYPVLNLSVSIAVILYELFLVIGKDKRSDKIKLVDSKEKEVLEQMLNDVLDSLEFTTEEMKDTQKVLWKRIMGKALMTQKEFAAMMGFLKKIREKKFKKF